MGAVQIYHTSHILALARPGGSDLRLTHDLLTVNRSDPVIILSPRQRGMHAFAEPACMPARLFVIFTFSSQVLAGRVGSAGFTPDG